MKDQADNLRRAIEKLSQAPVADQAGKFPDGRNAGPPRVLTATGGRGGVGATSICVNLAAALGEMNRKTLIIDADAGSTGVEALLGILPEYNPSDAVNNNVSLRDVVCDSHRGIRFIPCGAGAEEFARMDESQMISFASGFSELDNEYDAIIIDTGAGISDSVLGMAAAADEAIVITTPEPAALTDAYALIKAVTLRERDKPIRVIVNKAGSEAEADEIMSKLAQAADKFLDLKIRKLGYILNDPLVVRSAKLQLPFFINSPYSQASKKIREIALSLTDGTGFARFDKDPGLSGFFDRVAKFNNFQTK